MFISPRVYNQLIQISMSFQSLEALIEAIKKNEHFQHEIKGKRINKQLESLKNYKSEHCTLKRFAVTEVGVSFFVEASSDAKFYDFQVCIDFEYPFNRARLYYINQNSMNQFGQDLLDNVLTGQWGPSLLLSNIFDKLPNLAHLIGTDGNSVKQCYHVGEEYGFEQLKRYHVKFYDIEEYQWKYLIKHTSTKKLGLTNHHLMVFTTINQNILKLNFCIQIQSIASANAKLSKGKFQLQITCNTETDKSKKYFGGEEKDIEDILYLLNPIQSKERKLLKSEKQSEEDPAETIKKYSELIEHYSLIDKEKTKKYVASMQALIKKYYQQDHSEPKQHKMALEKQIET